jgi:YggT family protein
MAYILATSIGVFSQVLQIIIIVKIILSYILNPYHPLRSMIDRLVDPLLDPIRRVVPTIGMFDFSPLILIILVQLIAGLLIKFLLS